MFFYITSEVNQAVFDFIKETNILNKRIKRNLSLESFINFVKQDLRNIEINYLIIDKETLVLETTEELEEVLEAFYLLNPDCIVIILSKGQVAEPGLFELKQAQYNNYYIISDTNNLESQVQNIIVKTEGEYSIKKELDNKIQNEIQNELGEVKTVEHNGLDNSGEIKDEILVIIKPTVLEEKELPIDITETISPDVIYNKASKRIKISHGKPLSTRIKSIQNIEKDEIDIQNEKIIRQNSRDKGDSIPNTTNLYEYVEKSNHNKKILLKEWSCKNIMIGIVGTERKVGVTTAAFHLAEHLSHMGATITYTEANNHCHLEQIAVVYQLEQWEGHYSRNNITYYNNTEFDLDACVNFILFDLGSIQENTEWVLRIIHDVADEVIVVSGGKPYEQKVLKETLKQIESDKINLLFNLVSEDELKNLKSIYESQTIKISNIEYEPRILKPGHWKEDFSNLFQQYNDDTKHELEISTIH